MTLPAGLAYRSVPQGRDLQYLPVDASGNRVPVEKCTAFLITYTLRDTLTGEERTMTDDRNPHAIGDDDGAIGNIIFHYAEGNYACDCNRSRFWQRAGGVPEDELDDVECSHVPRYQIAAPDWLAKADEGSNR